MSRAATFTDESTSLLSQANSGQAEYVEFASSRLDENRPLFNKDFAESVYRRLVDNATVPGRSTEYLPAFLKNFPWIKDAIETLKTSDTQQILDFLKRLQKLRDEINLVNKSSSSEKGFFSAEFSKVVNAIIAAVENSCPNLQEQIQQIKNKESYDRIALPDSNDPLQPPENPKTSSLVNPAGLFTKAFAQSIYEALIAVSREAAKRLLVSQGKMFNSEACLEIKGAIESAQYAETQDDFFSAYNTIFQKMEESSDESFKATLSEILSHMMNYVFAIDPLLSKKLADRSMDLSTRSTALSEEQVLECATGAGCLALATIRPACVFWLFEVPCIAAQPVPFVNMWWIAAAAELGYLGADFRILTRNVEGTRMPIPTPFNKGREHCSLFVDACHKQTEVVNAQRVLDTVKPREMI